ncbi:hypothetical protein F2Q69_00059467 [Brassica cretica]|uniref:Uncharacterized protein n=1 Tax=Brassica cretica TaxID=69181 RepID=A0A8S9RPW2_BRACR|nr:hypothetical protein F2Q69_00059467 [Brassica cretica]
MSGRMRGGTSCSTWLAACLSLMQDDTTPSTCLDAWPGRMHRNTSCLADPPRAPHVYLHVQVSCTAAPHASLDKHTARSLPPRPEHTHIKTPQASRSIRPISAFPVNFSSRDQSQIFFYASSDALNIFNKLHLDYDLKGKYFPSFRLLRKIP